MSLPGASLRNEWFQDIEWTQVEHESSLAWFVLPIEPESTIFWNSKNTFEIPEIQTRPLPVPNLVWKLSKLPKTTQTLF